MGFGPAAGNFVLGSSASTSTIIDGGGRSLAGLRFPASMTGTGFYIKEGPNDSSSGANLAGIYSSAGSQATITLPAVNASSSLAVTVMLPPETYHTMRYMQLVASSAQSSAATVVPIWSRFTAEG